MYFISGCNRHGGLWPDYKEEMLYFSVNLKLKEQRWAYKKEEEKKKTSFPEGKDESYCNLKAPAAQLYGYKEPH